MRRCVVHAVPSGSEAEFFIALVIFIFCFYFVKQKKGVALGIAAFVALRLVWGLVVTLLQGGKF